MGLIIEIQRTESDAMMFDWDNETEVANTFELSEKASYWVENGWLDYDWENEHNFSQDDVILEIERAMPHLELDLRDGDFNVVEYLFRDQHGRYWITQIKP